MRSSVVLPDPLGPVRDRIFKRFGDAAFFGTQRSSHCGNGRTRMNKGA